MNRLQDKPVAGMAILTAYIGLLGVLLTQLLLLLPPPPSPPLLGPSISAWAFHQPKQACLLIRILGPLPGLPAFSGPDSVSNVAPSSDEDGNCSSPQTLHMVFCIVPTRSLIGS